MIYFKGYPGTPTLAIPPARPHADLRGTGHTATSEAQQARQAHPASQSEDVLSRLPDPQDAPPAPDAFDHAIAGHALAQRRREIRDRREIDALLERLQRGDGVPPFMAADPTGPHYCYRFENEVLELRPHRSFLDGEPAGYRFFLRGSGLMAQLDGRWVEHPDETFFAMLDSVWRAGNRLFVV